MVSCVACGRSKTARTKNLTFSLHRFPLDPFIRDLWIKFVGKSGWEPTKNSFICSQHFEERCFDKSSLSKIQLLNKSIPTIHIKRFKYDRALTLTAGQPKSEPLDGTCTSLEYPTEILPEPTTLAPAKLFSQSPSAEPDSLTKASLKHRIIELEHRDHIYCKSEPLDGTCTSLEYPTEILPEPATLDPAKLCLQSLSAEPDSPTKASLKRRIIELERRDLINCKKVRVLQKRCWYQKERIFYLTNMVKALLRNN